MEAGIYTVRPHGNEDEEADSASWYRSFQPQSSIEIWQFWADVEQIYDLFLIQHFPDQAVITR
jgi:hypothetical protein